MRRMLRFLGFTLLGLVGLAALLGALLGYLVYSPEPELPQLSGTVAKGAMEAGGLQRTYRSYLPRDLPKGAPLVIVMHGSGENSASSRIETGYGFERLADKHGFAVVYPDSYTFDWNDCSTIGEFSANGRPVDDVGFLGALVDKLAAETGIDPGRVFATGISAGGSMSIRLALEAPARYRAVAAVAASVPAPENFKCQPAGPGPSVMIMNGTKDPLVPFNGGEINLLGMFYKGGNVKPSPEAGQYFADLNKLSGAPETVKTPGADGISAEHTRWRNGGKTEVELVTIHGGGHGIPQPYRRLPRLLGPSASEPNGPELIWAFFQRQSQ
ncbi:alpha/beta hydrolase family esterase [Pseudoduganella namucuonensis]|uniref:Polyhydroxybutyrate depolymerase n=1 Tax=Pseudoduganella namucuonensis TaxID=1035707 RepID=A0A1I7KSA9_9BURK|nr:PHB depolymerase family esterase [Pseudoduganella namucuonensis]SFV00320.1 polyhydroxybutyrate depolymerase [Pseudoduganella namucuonensis]